MTSKHKLGDVGTKLLLENDRVKIWDLSLEPGQSSDWHHHTLDYITVGLTESKMWREYEDGTTDETTPPLGSTGTPRSTSPTWLPTSALLRTATSSSRSRSSSLNGEG